MAFHSLLIIIFTFNKFLKRLWATDHYQPLRIFAGHLADVNCTRFHPNSNYVATGSADRTVRLWDVLNGNCVRIFTGHKVFLHLHYSSTQGCYWDKKIFKKWTSDTNILKMLFVPLHFKIPTLSYFLRFWPYYWLFLWTSFLGTNSFLDIFSQWEIPGYRSNRWQSTPLGYWTWFDGWRIKRPHRYSLFT